MSATAAAAGIDIDTVTSHLFLGDDTLELGDCPHDLPRFQGKGVRMTAPVLIDRIERDAVASRKLEAVMVESEKLGREI